MTGQTLQIGPCKLDMADGALSRGGAATDLTAAQAAALAAIWAGGRHGAHWPSVAAAVAALTGADMTAEREGLSAALALFGGRLVEQGPTVSLIFPEYVDANARWWSNFIIANEIHYPTMTVERARQMVAASPS